MRATISCSGSGGEGCTRIYLLAFGTILAFAVQTHTTWKPGYALSFPEVLACYQNAELTEAAKVRFPFKKCRDHADVVKARFSINQAASGNKWF